MLVRRKQNSCFISKSQFSPPSFLVHKSCNRGCWLVYLVEQGHLPHTGRKCSSLVQPTRPGCPFPELCHSWEIVWIAAGKLVWKQFRLVPLAASVLLALLRCNTAPQPSAGPLTVCPLHPIIPNALALASPNPSDNVLIIQITNTQHTKGNVALESNVTKGKQTVY